MGRVPQAEGTTTKTKMRKPGRLQRQEGCGSDRAREGDRKKWEWEQVVKAMGGTLNFDMMCVTSSWARQRRGTLGLMSLRLLY